MRIRNHPGPAATQGAAQRDGCRDVAAGFSCFTAVIERVALTAGARGTEVAAPFRGQRNHREAAGLRSRERRYAACASNRQRDIYRPSSGAARCERGTGGGTSAGGRTSSDRIHFGGKE